METRPSRIRTYGFLLLCVLFTFAGYRVGGLRAQEPPGWNSAESAKLLYWKDSIKMPVADFKRIRITQTYFNNAEIHPFEGIHQIRSFAISGTVHLNAENSLVRVILVDTDLREYLVYEAYPLIVDTLQFSISNVCEETCLLQPLKPHSLKIELVDASIGLDEVTFLDSPEGARNDISMFRKQMKQAQDRTKIERIQAQIKKKGLRWTAGETSISELSHEEKRKLFGGEGVPNLQGAEYYKGGIFEIKPGDGASTLKDNGGVGLTQSFDWRDRHGANRSGSPYYDGDPKGSGWLTSITTQKCADCWAHAAIGATEALANLYFNQHLDASTGLDLSVQDILSCSGAGSCSGGSSHGALYYIATKGVVNEACYPYKGTNDSCANKCGLPDEVVRIGGVEGLDAIRLGEEGIKRLLIERGPLSFGISSWWHCLVLTGYYRDAADGRTVWILKNSWGPNWGENGYGSIKVDLSDIYLLSALQTPVTSLDTRLQIDCRDMDGDGYFNWGISEEKPETCPESAPPERDCDDSNPSLGPFDPDYHCVEQSADNLISNPGFENGTAGWHHYTNGQGGFSAAAPGYEGAKAALVEVRSPGTNVQLYQHGISLEPDTRYQLSFAAYSSSGRDLKVSLLKHVSPYTNYGLSSKKVNLGTGWAVHTISFTTRNFTAPVRDARLMFWLADTALPGDRFRIDNVVLQRSLLANPGFEAGTTPWKFYTNGQGSFRAVSPGHGSAKAGRVSITSKGANTQLYQAGISLEPNTVYRLTFAAYSSGGRDLKVSLLKHASPYTDYGLSRRKVDLGTGWAWHTISFTTRNFNVPVTDARLMFWLADTALPGDQFFIDDVVLAGRGARADLFVGMFTDVLRYNQFTGAYVETFVPAGSGGLNGLAGLCFGPDGNLYVSSFWSGEVLRYNGKMGDFIDVFVASGSGGLGGPGGVAFGPDANLYVADSFHGTNSVLRYDGKSGDFIDVFALGGGMRNPYSLGFGPDNNLFVGNAWTSEVLRYHGDTGLPYPAAGSSGAVFVPGTEGPFNTQLAFGPSGDLCVLGDRACGVLRYNGQTGDFIDTLVPGEVAVGREGIVFGPDGNMYLSNYWRGSVERYDGKTGAFMDVFVSPGSGGLNRPTLLIFGPPRHQ